ncbi:FRG domain-containing protein [Stutzerimonas balearica]|uniref:FRG domain-containing protein n=1 Tax=Stutzerimonas balearica TaxID=74829 RepID=UPI0028A5C4B6|nr:FRG domain-containing protein [Stutzerimonas balearica]
MLPNLDELRHRLATPAINTGRQIHLSLGHRAGPVTDDIEGLHAIADEQGRICLLSGTEFSMQMYRGQTKEHPRCIPTLARLEKVEEQILALCRRIAFEDAIGGHPMVSLAERIRLWDLPLYVDREGLAQHYGLATDMLDVTSHFDVACFFATCAWSNEDRRYQPVVSEEALGVMYRITPALMNSMAEPGEPFGPLHIVGWQPLPRPEQQRCFCRKNEIRAGLNLIAHCRDISVPTSSLYFAPHLERFRQRRGTIPKRRGRRAYSPSRISE